MMGTKTRQTIYHGIMVALCSVCFSALLQAEGGLNPIRLVPDLPADVRLNGDSTVTTWNCSGSDIEAVFETDLTTRGFYVLVQDFLQGKELQEKDLSEAPAEQKDLLRVYVEIRPKLLDCGNARMERDLHRAIRAEKYPVISYWFTGVDGDVRRLKNAETATFELNIHGIMVLADQPREVTHTARVRILALDELEVSGRLSLKMTDFDIEPPKALFGLVRAHDEFDVSYRFVVRPQSEAMRPPHPPPGPAYSGRNK